jgi:hypothetical protein
MSWAALARWLHRYRNPVTLAIAGAVAVSWLFDHGGDAVLGRKALKITLFIFVAVAIPVALALTALLVVAEQRAKPRRIEAEMPTARALPKPPPPAPAAQPRSAPATQARIAVEPTAPDDEPSMLR